MSFKTRHALAAIWLTAITVVGCSIGEKPPQPTPFEMGADEAGCMNGASTTLGKFLDGTLTDGTKITKLAECASHALQLFSDRVRGGRNGIYTPDELRDFLQTYFIKDILITDELKAHAMELKQVFVGGSADFISRQELQQTRSLITILRDHALELRPYMPLVPTQIGALPIEQADAATLTGATNALTSLARDLGGFIQTGGAPYSFKQLDKLLQSVQNAPSTAPGSALLGGLHQQTFVDRIRDNLDLIRKIKSSLIGGDEDAIPSGDWPHLLENSVRWYSLALRGGWLLKRGIPISSGEGADEFHDISNQAIELVSQSIQRHANGVITFEDLEALVDALPDDSLPKPYNAQPGQGVTKKTIKKILQPLIRRFLGGRNSGPEGRDAKGLTATALKRFDLTLDRWYDGQKLLEELFMRLAQNPGFQTSSPLKATYGRESILSSDLWEEIYSGTHGDQADRSDRILVADRLRALVAPVPNPLFQGDDPTRPIFERDGGEMSFRDGIEYSFRDLTDLSWMRELARLMIEGYAEDPKRADADTPTGAVNFAEFKTMFADLFDLGVEIKFFDPHDSNTALSRFREANLFTFSGNGDDLMDLREATQMLALLFSAKRLSNRLYQSISAKCPTGPLDEYNYLKINEECYREAIAKGYPKFFGHMPGLLKFLNHMDAEGRKAFFADLETAARKYGDDGWVDSEVTDRYAALAQYLEIIYARFDLDGSGTLTPSEADNAFPILKRTLGQMSKCQGLDLSDSQLNTVFTYLLAKGGMPDGVFDFAGWWALTHPPLSWFGTGNFDADRSRVVKIFSQLAVGTGPVSGNAACSEP